MIPLYFPFTYISPGIAKLLSGIFGRISVYQPVGSLVPAELKECSQSGVLDIRFPLESDDARIENLLKAHQSWAELHRPAPGSPTRLTHMLQSSANVSSGSTIRQEIKDRISGGKEKSHSPSDSARLFLALAQDFDKQQADLMGDMEQFERMEAKLFRDIKADGGKDGEKPKSRGIVQPDTGHYMISERLSAWLRLLGADKTLPCGFITTSIAAYEQFGEMAAEIRPIAPFDGRPVRIPLDETPGKGWMGLSDYLKRILRSDAEPTSTEYVDFLPPECTGKVDPVRLTLSVLRGQHPVRMSQIQPGPAGESEFIFPADRNILLALIESPAE